MNCDNELNTRCLELHFNLIEAGEVILLTKCYTAHVSTFMLIVCSPEPA